MTNILALDTASPLPAIALVWRGQSFERRLPSDRHVSETLLPILTDLLRESGATLADLSRIAVCSGPGSFTGVRVGLATAWGLGRMLGIPVESVPTLEALAETARDPAIQEVTAALEAGRGEVVIARYRLAPDRARTLSGVERLSSEEAARRLAGQDLVSLPEGLLGFRTREPRRSPALAAALAVAREPRETIGLAPVAIYARPSAAEEKLGAS